ncbi:predicted protein [Plenodomus lingam JN3]|uniref:Predicted protein n=1 Tax=Leptosphaeria maculans (strain JN3 / isolate v23.1.3 / race Av1-4-5-6-7-8) TaxID=985895 RepID=E5AEE7_LEPMJ|nr:predicted protein [Plenodomus lingam JN3]CBY01586.1 predicted protein [Plenodomus lingam JN3]
MRLTFTACILLIANICLCTWGPSVRECQVTIGEDFGPLIDVLRLSWSSCCHATADENGHYSSLMGVAAGNEGPDVNLIG